MSSVSVSGGRSALLSDVLAFPPGESSWLQARRSRTVVFISPSETREDTAVSPFSQELDGILAQITKQLHDLPSSYKEAAPEEDWFDLDARLQPPPVQEHRVIVRMRFIGREEPRIIFDPDID